ncbi:hypothetical protein [Brevibacillus sp. DP1.3A]|uniref:hypothetical protein n=1 Tax=Brevibacillus sp. DP1.3A TaxID=2738867 RepID=UPI00156B7B50|nr:hypothetical protein [Brevibacillus sp. DP1.3A]UED72332.1 hypothetical protein HP399_016365 [Brevibacillus sp. DP1.3A]
MFEITELIIWLVILALTISNIMIVRQLLILKRENVLHLQKMGFINEPNIQMQPVFNVEATYLFLTFTDRNNIDYIEQVSSSIGATPLYVIYHAPKWKAHLLSKKVSDKAKVLYDEEQAIMKYLGISMYPYFINVDCTGNIQRQGKWTFHERGDHDNGSTTINAG